MEEAISELQVAQEALSCKEEAAGLLEARMETLSRRRRFLTERAHRVKTEDQKRREQAGGLTNTEGSGEEASLSLVPSLRVKMMEDWTSLVQAAFIDCLCEKVRPVVTLRARYCPLRLMHVSFSTHRPAKKRLTMCRSFLPVARAISLTSAIEMATMLCIGPCYPASTRMPVPLQSHGLRPWPQF